MFDKIVEKLFGPEKCEVEHFNRTDFDDPDLSIRIYDELEKKGLTDNEIESKMEAILSSYLTDRLEQKLSELMDDYISMMQTAEYEETERRYLP